MRRSNEGLALILALLFIVLLTALVVDFTYEMQVEATFIEAQNSDLEAYLAAKSAIASGMGALAADLLFGGEEAALAGGGFGGGGTRGGGISSGGGFGGGGGGSQTSDVYDSLDEPWAESAPLVSINEAVMDATIVDEYGKINLNALIFGSAESGQEEVFEPLAQMVQSVFEYRGMEFIPLDAILDWLDSDDIPRPEGFENDYYENLETPYRAKNGPMDTIEELLLIPGITPEVFFGTANVEDAQGVAFEKDYLEDLGDPDAPRENDEDEEPDSLVPLSDLLTVHGHPEGKVNVNTAPPEVLEAVFAAAGRFADPSSAALDWAEARYTDGPARSPQDLIDRGLLPPPPPEQNQQQQGEPETPPPPIMMDIASSVFRVQGDGQSGDAQVRIEAYIWRDTHGSGAAQLFRVLDWRVIR